MLDGDAVIDAYYHGGCYFNLSDEDANVIARYESLIEKPPAIITKNIGLGRVILWFASEASNTHLGDFKEANNGFVDITMTTIRVYNGGGSIKVSIDLMVEALRASLDADVRPIEEQEINKYDLGE